MSLDVDALAAEVVRGCQILMAKELAPLQSQIAALVADKAALVARVAELETRAPVAGPQGPAGADGKDGERGADGLPGKDGIDGRDGLDGQAGRDGKDGIDGKDGMQGPAGRMPVVKAYQDEVHYAGDIVTHDGGTWQATCDTGRAPPHDDWTCLAAPGREGRSMRVRGTFDAEEGYQALDIVAMNGGSFVALRDGPGECPGPAWQLLTSPGKRGQKGEDGERGQAGPAGADLIAAEIDDQGLVTFRKSDGTTASLDLYPVLRRVM